MQNIVTAPTTKASLLPQFMQQQTDFQNALVKQQMASQQNLMSMFKGISSQPEQDDNVDWFCEMLCAFPAYCFFWKINNFLVHRKKKFYILVHRKKKFYIFVHRKKKFYIYFEQENYKISLFLKFLVLATDVPVFYAIVLYSFPCFPIHDSV